MATIEVNVLWLTIKLPSKNLWLPSKVKPQYLPLPKDFISFIPVTVTLLTCFLGLHFRLSILTGIIEQSPEMCIL